MRYWLVALALCLTMPALAADSWFDSLIEMRSAAQEKKTEKKETIPLPNFGKDPYTFSAWLRSSGNGTIFAKTFPEGAWLSGGKALFISGGRLTHDIGWIGAISGKTQVADGKWHHVALTGARPQKLYVDGKLDASGTMEARSDPKGNVLKLGWTSTTFPGGNNYLNGDLDDVRIFSRALNADEIEGLAAKRNGLTRGMVAHWPFDGSASDTSEGLNHAFERGKLTYVKGAQGEAIHLEKKAYLTVACSDGVGPDEALWTELQAKFRDDQSRNEMAWERADGIWGADWRKVTVGEVAKRYAEASQSPPSIATKSKALAAKAKTTNDLKAIRALYVQSRNYETFLENLSGYNFSGMRTMIGDLHGDSAEGEKHLAQVGKLENTALGWAADGAPDSKAFDAWKKRIDTLRYDALIRNNPLIDFDEILFVKRLTYSSNHYYTEFINAIWTPGGNLCALSLKDGSVRELVPQLQDGVFERFDLSFDGKKVVFAWKSDAQEGYRIYEVNVDGTGLHQITFPPENEKEIQKSYRVYDHYHHGTDDMHPCYLPDGGIVFISTRCQYGILCDGPDDFTTTILYRMDPDGKNMKPLTNSSVSEASPTVLPDGRIMYTRWEYVDKGAVSVKCLWSMRPDGTASSEIYANDISLPPTFIYGRPIPDVPNQYVVLGTPHCPQNGVGTVIRLDMNRNIRTRDPMTYMTPYTDIQAEGGFSFRTGDGPWKRDGSGRGPLFKDPYPLSMKYFLVSAKPEGPIWKDPKGYGLSLLDENGNLQEIYRDPEISCWMPFPLKARKTPPIATSPVNEQLAEKDLAMCIVTDVYHGMEGVERGTIKYLRVLEQIPRPWSARRRWGGDVYDQQHATVTKDTHLGLKVQYGIVPVEKDGSANFMVPALRNIFLQALDENHMAVQTERTYVNYMPGEMRSCVGCHETPNEAAVSVIKQTPLALRRAPSVPGPQPGEKSGKRLLDFANDVQPVLDKHCIECHGDKEPKADLKLTGEQTTMFSVAYENLIPERRGGKGRKGFELVGPTIGENHPKTGNVHYMPTRSFGSHASVLVAMLSKGKVKLQNPKGAKMAEGLAKAHEDVKMKPEELLKITNWVDTNSQFYGTYWGRKNIKYKDHPNYRPTPTFEEAVSTICPTPEDER